MYYYLKSDDKILKGDEFLSKVDLYWQAASSSIGYTVGEYIRYQGFSNDHIVYRRKKTVTEKGNKFT